MSRLSRCISVGLLFLVAGLTACSEADEPASTEQMLLAPRARNTCDFRDIVRDARGYFPGQGNNSVLSQVQEVLDLMAQDCATTDQAAYTAHWFDVAALVQGVLEAGSGQDAADGASFLQGTLSVVAPDGTTRMFDPCDGAAGCLPWEGFPTPLDFASVLGSEKGAWAVVTTGTDAVCSSFQYPCSGLDPAITGDDWGAEPSVNWQLALAGRQTLVFGVPIPGPSPTGEPLLATELPAYQWLLIPEPARFGVDLTPPAIVEVGLCSTAASQIDEILVQRNTTVLTEGLIDFCPGQQTSLARSEGSFLRRLASAVGSVISPKPAPLMASRAVASIGPGGRAGGFTDFYAIDVPRAALVKLSSQPARGTVGQTIVGQDGQPLVVSTVTSSMESPIEDALVTMRVLGNNGLIPSGNGVSGAELACDGFLCTGRTQPDEGESPGTLELGLVFTKTGSYTLCFSATLPPLDFGNEVCTEKFVVNP